MKRFHKILFVSNGIREECAALKQAILLAQDNKAVLDVLILCPPFSPQLKEYKNSYETFLLEKMHETINTAKKSVPHSGGIKIQVDIEWGNTPDIRIVQRVIRSSYDLVIKEVENNEASKGFKALDMSLLRKCPCELFLHRSFNTTEPIHIAVAIDPNDEEVSGHNLSIGLLQLSYALKKHYKSRLSIVSCWDSSLVRFLRHSVFIDISAKELDEQILEESNNHYQLINALIHEADINESPKIYHLQGTPVELIPSFIEQQKVDILVMGTVARTGISGFIIGNTAEDIVQKITCSLWAMKPPCFVSPVTV